MVFRMAASRLSRMVLTPLLSATLAASPALAAQDKPMTDDDPDAVDVAKTPVTDLNIDKKEIPAILLQAQARPYSLTGLGRCKPLIAEVSALDDVLGPDLDLPEEERARISAGRVAKTGIMVGIGERDDEVLALIDEVQAGTSAPGQAGERDDTCDILTIGQYLQPTRNHLPIDRWVTPEQFAAFKAEGLSRGFKVVESGPLVRSSYHADHQADVLSTIGAERAKRG